MNRLWQAADQARASLIEPLLILVIEAEIRREEHLLIQWRDVDTSAYLNLISKTRMGMKE